MKNVLVFLLIALLACAVSGCGDWHDTDYAAGDTSNVEIDYGESALYTKEDMDAAIRVIKEKFRDFKGCELHRIYFVSDAECKDTNIRWLNELEKANDAKEHFTQCILFESDFHTGKKNDDGFTENTEYTHWNWWLGRSDGGEWKLMTWGY